MGEVCVMLGKATWDSIIIMSTSPCLTAAPLLYEDIKSRTVISKFNSGKLHQNYPERGFYEVGHMTRCVRTC